MKTHKKKEVVKYFENAKEVACLCNGKSYDISENITRDFYEWNNGFWIDTHIDIKVWDETHGYAKILSYKEPKEKTYKIKQETGMDSITINDVKYIKEDKDLYKITTEQILEISEKFGNDNSLLAKSFLTTHLKQIFPEVFETKLTVGKWYKSLEHPKQIIFASDIKDVQHIKGYGFNTRGDWESCDDRFSWGLPTDGSYIEATEQEVEKALRAEIKKRYPIGCYVKSLSSGLIEKIKGDRVSTFNCLVSLDGSLVFEKGKWAEIIPTLTIQEAEAKLNCKII